VENLKRKSGDSAYDRAYASAKASAARGRRAKKALEIPIQGFNIILCEKSISSLVLHSSSIILYRMNGETMVLEWRYNGFKICQSKTHQQVIPELVTLSISGQILFTSRQIAIFSI
jgi:hypothetical protein